MNIKKSAFGQIFFFLNSRLNYFIKKFRPTFKPVRLLVTAE
jgi:hypothetical protein